MGSDKQSLRKEVWEALAAVQAERYPGAHGRIPNFNGAEAAAEQLQTLPEWQAARTIKINPDSPQLPVRYAALKQGRRVYLPVPRLADKTPFIELDPGVMPVGSAWVAASIEGAMKLGRPISIDEMPTLDLIVTGCVAADVQGARLGKGGGYSDLEYAMLREAGKVTANTVIATTLHPRQILDPGRITVEDHDISLDLMAVPSRVIRTNRTHPRPAGLLWERLSETQRLAMPCLQQLWKHHQDVVVSS
ncbi:MAG: 5-formyltetrahydrofolate cyclo-ligase [Myxococcota bacterium]